jgi:predicted transposase
MKPTLQLQPPPTAERAAELLDPMRRFNAAASFAARVGFEHKVYGQVSIHGLCYHEIRERYGLSAQMAVRAIAKAVSRRLQATVVYDSSALMSDMTSRRIMGCSPRAAPERSR